MPKHSAGLLVYRYSNDNLEVFLVHPGGPFWTKKDAGVWSIPKGEFIDEEPLEAAKREFEEETNIRIHGQFTPLTPIKQSNAKIVYAWAIEADFDSSKIKSNPFTMEWPPKSGKYQEFPEIDKGQWFTISEAIKKILKGQTGLIKELIQILDFDAEKRPSKG